MTPPTTQPISGQDLAGEWSLRAGDTDALFIAGVETTEATPRHVGCRSRGHAAFSVWSDEDTGGAPPAIVDPSSLRCVDTATRRFISAGSVVDGSAREGVLLEGSRSISVILCGWGEDGQ